MSLLDAWGWEQLCPTEEPKTEENVIDMDENIIKELEKWVRDNYKQYSTGWTWLRSEGNCCDCFDDGCEHATSWAAYEVGCILGMDLEEPDEPDYDEC